MKISAIEGTGSKAHLHQVVQFNLQWYDLEQQTLIWLTFPLQAVKDDDISCQLRSDIISARRSVASSMTNTTQ